MHPLAPFRHLSAPQLSQLEERMQAFFVDVMLYVLVECFDAERLSLFKYLGYAIMPLQENSNYLLMPPGAPFSVA